MDIRALSQQIQKSHNRPLVTLKWAQTLDGQLADDAGTSKWISGPEELHYTHLLRSHCDAILVGASTFLNDHSKLTVRLPSESQHLQPALQPVRVILDLRNRITSQILNQKNQNSSEAQDLLIPDLMSILEDKADRPTVVLHTEDSSVSDFVNHGGSSRPSKLEFLNVNESAKADLGIRALARLCEFRFQRPIRSLMVEGGPATLKLFLEKNLADIACVGIAPMITGGFRNRIQLMRSLEKASRFRHYKTHSVGRDSIIEMISKELTP